MWERKFLSFCGEHLLQIAFRMEMEKAAVNPIYIKKIEPEKME